MWEIDVSNPEEVSLDPWQVHGMETNICSSSRKLLADPLASMFSPVLCILRDGRSHLWSLLDCYTRLFHSDYLRKTEQKYMQWHKNENAQKIWQASSSYL